MNVTVLISAFAEAMRGVRTEVGGIPVSANTRPPRCLIQGTTGKTGSLSANIGKTGSQDRGSDVKGFRACTDYYFDG